jgi:glucokinase
MNKESETLVLGIDLGGTKILTAVANFRGEMLARDHSITPAAMGQEAVLRSIVESVNRAMDQAGILPTDIDAIGVGAPGPSNPDTGILFTSPNLPGWVNVPLRDIIEKELGRKVFLINDANAAAVGEFYYGAAQGVRDFIYITVSTGIGGGIFIDGKLFTGAIGTAAEIGHITIDDKGPRCNCGNRGCWEALASGTALAREARERISRGAETSIMKYAEDDIEKVTAEVIHRAAEHGDTLARELISQTGYYLGVGMANLINLFNPERIVIGGGLSGMGEMLLGVARRVAGERAYRVAFEVVDFVSAKLGRNSGVLGAAAFALQKISSDQVNK